MTEKRKAYVILCKCRVRGQCGYATVRYYADDPYDLPRTVTVADETFHLVYRGNSTRPLINQSGWVLYTFVGKAL